MQTSELYRRGIVIPLDDSAEERMRKDDVIESMSVHFVPLANEVFVQLWRMGFFYKINEHCSVLLDDYEQDVVEPLHAKRLLEIVSAITRDLRKQPDELTSFLHELHAAVSIAADIGRPMWFVL
jgi:hypothetical protein